MINAVEEKAWWWGVIAPLAALVLSLKIWRILERAEVVSWWVNLDLVRSDLLIVAAFGALGWVALRGLGSTIKKTTILGTLQALAIGWALLEMVAHNFFTSTGSTFDLHLLFFSLGRFDETFSIIASEVPTWYWAFSAAVVAIFLVLPWGVRAYFVKRQEKRQETSLPNPNLLYLSLTGLALALLALAPPAGEDYVAFGRASLVNMALSIQDVRGVEEIEMRRTDLYQLYLEEKEDFQGPRNVAIIILESTRAPSMTVYDPDWETTPFLAELAEKSLVADRAYAVVPHTSKALVAILCGLEPRLRMPITEALPDGIPARCLANLLGDEGYRSVFMQSATERFEDRPGLVENMGYDDFIPLAAMDTRGFEEANYFGREDAIMLPPSKEWLQNHGDQPFLATYLTLTPHHDYLAPTRYGRFDFVEDDELNRYKNTLYYVDQFSRELLEQYQELGLYEDTLFVFVGDHGEGFEEHGRSQHDNVIWEEGIHVPFIVYDPLKKEGQRISYPVSHIDVVPTILDAIGFEPEGARYPGMPASETGPDRSVFAHCWYERRCMARVGHRWKYIDHFGRQSPEVFDILEDPLETENLADDMPDDVRQWRAEVYGWRTAVNSLYRIVHRDRVEENIFSELPEDVVELDFQIGDFVQFRGYTIDTDQARRGRRMTVTYYFEALEQVPEGWSLFVHGENQGRMINLDHVPVQGLHPLNEWEPGTIIADEHSFRIPRDWGRGTFELYLGIWHREEGRAPIWGDVETDDDRRAKILELPIR